LGQPGAANRGQPVEDNRQLAEDHGEMTQWLAPAGSGIHENLALPARLHHFTK
jgi:hypothetical protein